MIYVLDTTVCRDLIKNPSALDHRQNVLAANDKICLTMISFGESVGGWLPKCRHAKNGTERAEAYANLYETFLFTDARFACLLMRPPQKSLIGWGRKDYALASTTLLLRQLHFQ